MSHSTASALFWWALLVALLAAAVAAWTPDRRVRAVAVVVASLSLAVILSIGVILREAEVAG